VKHLSDHIYIVLSIFFAVASQLIIKWQMNSRDFGTCSSIAEKFIHAFTLLLNPYIILSILLTLLSGLSWMIAMTRFDISYAYPYTALGFVLILIFSALLFHESIDLYKILGVLLIISGIYLASRSS